MAAKKNILVVDDAEDARALYKKGLADEGYDVTLACDAEEALAKINQQTPDLITLDSKISEMDGMDFLDKLAAENRDIPVVMRSTHGSCKQDFRIWASSAYVVKSADLGELKLTIKEILEF